MSQKLFNRTTNVARLRLFLILLAVAAALVGPVWLARYSPARAQEKKLRYQQDLEKVFVAHEDLRIDSQTFQEARTSGKLSLTTLSHHFDLELQPNDLRSADYRAEEVVDGAVREIPRGAVNTYKGTINGLPGTDARFTLDNSRLEGMIMTADDTYFVEPASNYSSAAEPTEYLLYRDSDVRSDITRTCADTLKERVALKANELKPDSSGSGPNVVSPMKVVEIATEADDEYVTAAGGSSAANAEILTTLNQVDAIYQRDVGLTFSVVFQHAWVGEGSDPYSASGDAVAILNEFTNYWNANISNPRDVAHMWTGRSMGGAAGFAWTGVMCQAPRFSYGVSIRELLPPFRVGIPAHEIGHNFNASHCDGQAGCDNTIMVAAQSVANTLTFCQFSIDEITRYVIANPTCLSNVSSSTIQFNTTLYPVNEGSGAATLTVTRTSSSGAATVNYTTSDAAGLQSCTSVNGRASERCDYVTSVGTVRFADGELSKTISIPLIDDAWIEGVETFSVTLSAAAGGTLASPSVATVSIIENDTSQPTTNPIDGVAFFIRQQYLDILNRQPDAGGFQNWVNTLTPCPNGGFGEPPTSNCDRLHVAAGFFQSDEFLNRGYFAFRFYMVAYNQRPTYAQFIPDMAQVGGPKSPAEEEASKVTYANAFVQRPEFLARYPGLSGQPLANALLATAGLPGPYNAGSQTNGQILRGIAESSAALNKFLTEGTVSIMYFGFQRRDPDAIGYQNNLNTLNASPNNLRHMIFIFIYSTEYRSRFGP